MTLPAQQLESKLGGPSLQLLHVRLLFMLFAMKRRHFCGLSVYTGFVTLHSSFSGHCTACRITLLMALTMSVTTVCYCQFYTLSLVH